jgi:hypothetical protein
VSEKLKILEMLHKGTISPDEASQLLEAIGDLTPEAGVSETAAPPIVSPNMQRFRRFSYIPFGISLFLLLLVGWGTWALSHQVDGRITAGFVILVILLVFVFLATSLAFAMTRMPWLHVRVQDRSQGRDGETVRKKLAISLPVPLSLAQWGLRIAHRYVGEDQAANLDVAATMLRTVGHDLGKPGTDPIIVDVDDEDERVQVYIG